MKKQKSAKVKDALENAANYISQMVEMPDQKLEKHLDIVKQQQEMAYRQRTAMQLNYSSFMKCRLLKQE